MRNPSLRQNEFLGSPIAGLAFLVFPLVFLIGCAIPYPFSNKNPVPPTIEKSYSAKQVTLQQLQDEGVALGGIVIGQGATVRRYPDLPDQSVVFEHLDQTEFWSSNLERKFSDNVNDLTATPFFQFDDFIEDDLMTSIWSQYSQGGYIPQDLLESLHASRPGVRFLILVRVDYDDVSHDINTSWIIAQKYFEGLGRFSRAGYDPAQTNQSQRPTIKRVVGMTMGVFDMETALCVWEAGVIREVSTRIDPMTLNDYSGFQAKQLESGQVTIVEGEDFLDAPAFNPVLDKCLDALFSDMFKEMDGRTS